MPSLEEAQADLAQREAEAVEAQRVLDEATAAVATAQAEVHTTTAQIEDHDGGDGIEALAAARAVAVARVEALTARAKAKVQPVQDAQAAVQEAMLAVDQIVLAEERRALAEAEAELKQLVVTAAREADERRVAILGIIQAANNAGYRVASAKGTAKAYAQYARTQFETGDQIVGLFKSVLDAGESGRARARQAELDRRRQEHEQKLFDNLVARGGWTPPEPAKYQPPPFTPPPVEVATGRTINDLND